MAEPASARSWTDDELLAVFGPSDTVFARDGVAGSTAVPPVLARPGRSSPLEAWSDQVARLHPEDRGATVRVWWDALQHPGELRELRVRSRGVRGWRCFELRYVNLLHQPGIRAVLVGLTDQGPIDVDDGPRADTRHERPSWVFQEIDALGVILRTEGDTDAVFGQAPAALAGRNILELLHPDDHDAALAMWVELMASPGATRVIRQRIVRPDASELWIESTVTNRLDEDTGAMVGISLDISERLEQEQAVRASQEAFRTLAEEVPTAVVRADREGRITFGNGRWFHLTALVGVVERLVDIVAAEHRVEWERRWADFVVDPTSEAIVLEYPTPDHRRVLSLHSRRVPGDGAAPSFVGVLTDVTDVEELRHRADHDALTGLLNREAFDRLVANAIEANRPAVVAFVDLDGFKEVNDQLGHDAGDHVLTEVARRLSACVRPGDAVGRYGGDEFVVLCIGLPEGGEKGLRGRLADALEPPVTWDTGAWTLQASIGAARARRGDDVSDVVRRADHAMYEEKRTTHRRRRAGWWATSSV